MGQEGARVEIRACLGRGGFGEVYRAAMTRPGGVQTEVAVKVLRSDVDPGSEAVKRLRDEGRLLAALRHPAILHVHDLVMLDGRVALITEYVDGEDLDLCILGEPPIPVRALLSVLGDVAAALDAAWSTPSPNGQPIQLVHRDIKPSNIRIGRHGEVKLLDFGIARATNMLREAHTASNAVMGSYLYMAPERYREDAVEPPSDVYSLGCVLYEGLATERFFENTTLKGIYNTMVTPGRFHSHLETRMRELADVPTDVLVLLRDLLNPDDVIRPTAAEASARLEELAESLPGDSFRRWLRQRAWREQPTVAGTLDGQELFAEAYGSDTLQIRTSLLGGRPLPPDPSITGGILGSLTNPAMRPAAVRGMSESTVGGSTEEAPEWHGDPRATIEPTEDIVEDIADEITVDREELNVAVAADLEATEQRTADSLPLSQRKTIPPLSHREDEAVMSAEEPAASHAVSPGAYQQIDPEEMVEPIPEVFDEVRPRRRSPLAQGQDSGWGMVLGGGLAATVVLGALGAVVLRDELDSVAQQLPSVQDWILEESQTTEASPGGAAGASESSTPALPAPEEAVIEIEGPAAPPVRPRTKPVRQARAAPQRPSRARLRSEGWAAVDRSDFEVALDRFNRALRSSRADADAHYGRGYALMRLGQREAAEDALCAAVKLGSDELKREVRSVMESHGMECGS